jgi:hypothetical protein
MGGKENLDPADTYIFDEDVLDEMEGFNSTIVESDAGVDFTETLTQENELLDDIASSSVVLEGSLTKKG